MPHASRRVQLVAAALACVLSAGLVAQPAKPLPVKPFLQSYVRERLPRGYLATRFSAATVRLSDDGVEDAAIVYLTGDGWCGSGGCTMLILAREAESWRVVTKITITRLPIRVLNQTSHGWHTIGVWVEGGDIRAGYEAELRFDGRSYPKNPSTLPARPLSGEAGGEVVISTSQEGTPLFP